MMMDNVCRPIAQMTFLSVEHERLRFKDYCQALNGAGVQVDLQDVLHCDSAGIALLIEIKRICRALGCVSTICNMPTSASALAEFYGIRELLND